MKILDSAQAQKDAANIFQGEIDHYIFEGSNIRYWISALDSMINSRHVRPGRSRHQEWHGQVPDRPHQRSI